MQRKTALVAISVLIVALAYFGAQYVWLRKTDKLPYANLTHTDSGSCYIFFNVENNDSVYRVVMPNTSASILVYEESRLLYYLYPLYMNEIISHELAVDLNDAAFDKISSYVVDPNAVSKLEERDLLNDTTIFINKSYLRHDVKKADFNAIIYLFIRNGSNCCVDDYSGATSVSRVQ